MLHPCVCDSGITDYRLVLLAKREANMVLFGRLLPLALAWVGLRAAQGLFDEVRVARRACA